MKKEDMAEARRRAAYLFEELGQVDDSYLAAAEQFQKRLRQSFAAGTALRVLAASLALFLGIRLVFLFADRADEKEESVRSLSLVLAQVENAGAGETVANLASLTYFETPALIWQLETGDYAVFYLDRQTAKTLWESLENNDKSNAEEMQETAENACWLSLGNGLTLSPYLSYSPGNVGYNQCQPYAPETEPPEEFVQTILRYLQRTSQI